jgi:hypothetical protein
VDEIVARYVAAARGGREALAAVKTLRMTGRAIAGPGREAIVRREIARPCRIRTEFVFQGTTGVYVWDGAKGWQISPLDGRFEPEPMSAEAAPSAPSRPTSKASSSTGRPRATRSRSWAARRSPGARRTSSR